MKKTLSILTILMLLAGVFTFTGCGDLGDLMGPTDTWCGKTFTLQEAQAPTEGNSGKPAVTADVYFYYATNKTSINLGRNSSKVNGSYVPDTAITLEPGLTIVIASKTVGENDYFKAVSGTGNDVTYPFLIKHFNKGEDIEFGANGDEDGTTKSIEFKKEVWNAIYLCNFSSMNQYTKKNLPLVADYQHYESTTDVKAGFSWKKIMTRIALNKLEKFLEED